MILRRIIWPVVRFFLQLYWRITRPLTAGARGVVQDGDGRILLVRHTYIPGWYLPGGGVDKNETLREAMVRELDEEVGVLVRGEAPLIGVFANFREHKSDHVALYLVRDYEMEPRPNREIAEFGFFHLEDAPEGTTRSTLTRMREVLTGSPPPEYW